MIRKAVPALALGLLLIAGRTARADIPKEIEELRIQQRLGEQTPLQLTFRDENGRSVRLRDLTANKAVILVLAYYRCPRLCSQVLRNLEQSLTRVPLNAGDDFQVVIVSFDPEERPELAAANKKVCLERYNRPGTENGWHFLTGEKTEIQRLADAVGFRFKKEPSSGQYRHAAGIMLLTPEGKVARYLMGLDYPPRELRLGLVEAAGGKIGTPVDNALLWTCLSFDPAAGKYNLAALKLVRAAGVVTIVLLGTYLAWNWLRAGWHLGRRAIRRLLGTSLVWNWMRRRPATPPDPPLGG
jgi:protein SCO1/2